MSNFEQKKEKHIPGAATGRPQEAAATQGTRNPAGDQTRAQSSAAAPRARAGNPSPLPDVSDPGTEAAAAAAAVPSEAPPPGAAAGAHTRLTTSSGPGADQSPATVPAADPVPAAPRARAGNRPRCLQN